MHAFVREPLVQFLLIGALLFAGAHLFEARRDAEGRQIVIDTALEHRLAKLYALQMGAPPARAQLDELIEAHVHEEVLYREALSMGLAEDDEIIRRRLVQKLEFLSTDLTAEPEPAETALRAFYAANVAQFTSEPGVTFEHVYFSPDVRGADAAQYRAKTVLAGLRVPSAAEAGGGDPFPLQSGYAQMDRAAAIQVFGKTPIVDALFTQPSGEWRGPVRSGLGWHLIRIAHRTGGSIQPYEAVRDRVRQMYEQERAERAKRECYEKLRARYEVVRATETPPPLAR